MIFRENSNKKKKYVEVMLSKDIHKGKHKEIHAFGKKKNEDKKYET